MLLLLGRYEQVSRVVVGTVSNSLLRPTNFSNMEGVSVGITLRAMPLPLRPNLDVGDRYADWQLPHSVCIVPY